MTANSYLTLILFVSGLNIVKVECGSQFSVALSSNGSVIKSFRLFSLGLSFYFIFYFRYTHGAKETIIDLDMVSSFDYSSTCPSNF